MNDRTTSYLIAICVLLAVALGYFIYKTSIKETVVIRGEVITVMVDPPAETIHIKGKPFPMLVADTTVYQRYLDSVFHLNYSLKDTIIKKTSEPFGDTGTYGRVYYNIRAYPDLNHRTIDAVFDLLPLTIDTTLQDTTRTTVVENDNYLYAVVAFVIAFILGKIL
jgi:hypothetical protein